MYNIHVRESVITDLEELTEYIFRATFSRESAEEVYDKIMASIIGLKIFPFKYPIFEGNYRVMTVYNKYRIFYRVDKNNNEVIIQFIFSTDENYHNLIK
ncbi:MAG: type II toxin-antitoxin system RelE/ParE family toxin [Candidatus Gracilibacteria bacterium]|nr:type II toxin-antitoxin system RelE/ParE family toxin [Candidatus Gracilibacteria bacterium]